MRPGVALPEDGNFISGMGLDFSDYNNDGYPDIVYVALNNQTFPLLQNTGKGDFREVTTPSGMREASLRMAGYGAAFIDFDNDGWKDIFVTRGHVESMPLPGAEIDEFNTVFRNPGPGEQRQRQGRQVDSATPRKRGWLRCRRRAIAAAPSAIWMATAASMWWPPRLAPTRRYG